MSSQSQVEIRIESEPRGLFNFGVVKELWRYRDLVWFLIRRDFLATYEQTLLGPLWLVLQPLLSCLVMVLVFRRAVNLPTDGLPAPLFYLSGLLLWNFFAGSLSAIASSMKTNAGMLGKVYFPRLCLPCAIVLAKLNGLVVHALLLASFWIFFAARGECSFTPQAAVRVLALLPGLVVTSGLLAWGTGLVIAALTVRYRDLQQVVQLLLGLWMYATPIIYPLSRLSPPWQRLLLLNPLSPVVELLRAAAWGTPMPPLLAIGLAIATALAAAAVGALLFSLVEGNLADHL